MKAFISIILLFAFITVNFSKVLIVSYYEFNKKQITEQYCVNKDKPQMHCCGKCHLKKQLAAQEEQQKSPAIPDIKNDIQLFGSPVVFNFNPALYNSQSISSYYTGMVPAETHSAIFHPPCC